MIVVKYNGGIGNQLFQYAFSLYCKQYCSTVYADTAEYRRKTIHGGFLLETLIPTWTTEFPTISDEASQRWNTLSLADRVSNKLLHHFGKHYFEAYFSNTEQIVSFLADHKNSYLEGYWQNIHIVQPVLAKLQEGIVPPEKVTVSEWYNRLSTNNAIALHIRRGDYLSSPDARRHYGNICTESYYTAAVKIMRKLVPYAHFYVFTNDYKYCTQKYGTDAAITVIPPCTDQSAYHDLLLMAQCPHHILANSSFSWWGTMLSTQPGYTIMPSVWDNCVVDCVGNKCQPSGGLCREVQAATRLQENHSTVYINPELVYTTEPQYARGKAIAVSALAFMSNSAPAYTLLAFCEKPESLDNHKLGAQSLKF